MSWLLNCTFIPVVYCITLQNVRWECRGTRQFPDSASFPIQLFGAAVYRVCAPSGFPDDSPPRRFAPGALGRFASAVFLFWRRFASHQFYHCLRKKICFCRIKFDWFRLIVDKYKRRLILLLIKWLIKEEIINYNCLRAVIYICKQINNITS